jgi:hypothetical protein
MTEAGKQFDYAVDEAVSYAVKKIETELGRAAFENLAVFRSISLVPYDLDLFLKRWYGNFLWFTAVSDEEALKSTAALQDEHDRIMRFTLSSEGASETEIAELLKWTPKYADRVVRWTEPTVRVPVGDYKTLYRVYLGNEEKAVCFTLKEAREVAEVLHGKVQAASQNERERLEAQRKHVTSEEELRILNRAMQENSANRDIWLTVHVRDDFSKELFTL